MRVYGSVVCLYDCVLLIGLIMRFAYLGFIFKMSLIFLIKVTFVQFFFFLLICFTIILMK